VCLQPLQKTQPERGTVYCFVQLTARVFARRVATSVASEVLLMGCRSLKMRFFLFTLRSVLQILLSKSRFPSLSIVLLETTRPFSAKLRCTSAQCKEKAHHYKNHHKSNDRWGVGVKGYKGYQPCRTSAWLLWCKAWFCSKKRHLYLAPVFLTIHFLMLSRTILQTGRG